MGDLSFVSGWDRDWVVVRLSGDLVFETVGDFRTQLGRLAGRRIKLDLTRLHQIDENGIAALRAARSAFEHDGRVLVVEQSPPSPDAR